MKRFFHIILRFSLLPVLFIVPTETFIALRKNFLFKEKNLEKLFTNKAADYAWIPKIENAHKVLLLGSSTVHFGLHCDTLNRLAADSIAFINLGADGRDPVETYFILKGLDLRSVKEMYYALDPWMFARSYYKERDSYFYLDLGIRQSIRFAMHRDSRLFLKRYKAFFASFFPSSTPVPRDTIVPLGFGSDILNRPPVNFSDPVHSRFQLGKYGWSDLQFEYLERIEQFCKERNIAFHLFYTPKRIDFIRDYETNAVAIHASFLEKMRSAGVSTPIQGSIDQLKGHGNNIFADAYHLNRPGQSLYSAVFFRMIKNTDGIK